MMYQLERRALSGNDSDFSYNSATYVPFFALQIYMAPYVDIMGGSVDYFIVQRLYSLWLGPMFDAIMTSYKKRKVRGASWVD